MPDARPLSPTTTAILAAIAEGVHHGFDIMDATGLASGTVYPVLTRMERNGLVRTKWESAEISQREKRPTRRYYEVTASGRRALAAALEHYRRLGRGRFARGER